MSDRLSAGDDDRTARRHAAWALLVLALVAVIVATVMLFVLGTSQEPKSRGPLAQDGPTSATPAGTSSGAPSGAASTGGPSGSPTTSPTDSGTSPLPSPGDTVHPCPTSAACIVSGDVGGALTAINALRTSHGVPPVTGSVSVAAQQCALQQGDGPNCAPHYAWQPVARPDGALVASLVSSDWLLDPKVAAFQVGWAYLPGRGGAGGQWACAVLKLS